MADRPDLRAAQGAGILRALLPRWWGDRMAKRCRHCAGDTIPASQEQRGCLNCGDPAPQKRRIAEIIHEIESEAVSHRERTGPPPMGFARDPQAESARSATTLEEVAVDKSVLARAMPARFRDHPLLLKRAKILTGIRYVGMSPTVGCFINI